MKTPEQMLTASAERSLPVFLNGDDQNCLDVFQRVLGSTEHVVVHCQSGWGTSELYLELLRNSACDVPVIAAQMDIQDTTDALDAAGYQWVVLVGFHNLPEETQKDFAFDLKVAFETARLNIVVIGCFPAGNPLLLYNGDLYGRITEIKVNDSSHPRKTFG